jgi:phosphopentomutase
VETTVVTPELPGPVRYLAGALLRLGGVARLAASSSEPNRLLDTALHTVGKAAGPAFVVAYLNDADLAGHAWGWMSPAYLQAANGIDRCLTGLMSLVSSPEHLVIITADHGGGGVLERDHDHPHPVNEAIPLLLLGGRVLPGFGHDQARLLDVPPTVLHHFGLRAPPAYEGRVLEEAFTPAAACA